MQQLGSIYIIENDVNDKVYIGQTVYTLAERAAVPRPTLLEIKYHKNHKNFCY